MSRHRVVIIGGGFGGLRAALALGNAPVEVTLLDRCNYHLFQPLLYQVATGGLSGGDIASPLRGILRKQRNTKVLLGEMTGLNTEGRRVILSDGEVPYDTLVVAAGSSHSYFGNEHWRRHAPGLKSLDDASEIRRKILAAFEQAEKETDPAKRRSWLSFVVVGAGPTGVELAGALAEVARDTLRNDFRTIQSKDAEIQLIDMSTRVLSTFPPALSAKAERALVQLGVRPRSGVKVKDIDQYGVLIQDESGATRRIGARTVLWAAGVKASPLADVLRQSAAAELDGAGRVIVNSDCTVKGHREIFVIGDMAHLAGNSGKTLPGVAPVAMQQGAYVGRAIHNRLRGRPVEPFRYVDKGNLATIGRNHAVADFGSIGFNGRLAWLTWLFVHLLYLVGFQNRVLVAVQWAFHYFTYNRKARLILGNTDRSSG